MSMEDAIRGVHNHLFYNLAAELATISTVRGIVIPLWAEISMGPSLTHQMPLIEVLPDKEHPEYSNENANYSAGWDYDNIVLAIAHEGSDPKAVMMNVVRYAEGIKKLIEKDDTFDGVFVDVKRGDVDYAAMVRDSKTGIILQVAMVPLTVKQTFNG